MSMEYAVLTTRAKMPSSCWGASNYVNVGLIKYNPKVGLCRQIRDTKSQKVIWSDHRLYSGSTDKCAAAKAINYAKKRQEELERRQLMQHLAKMEGYQIVSGVVNSYTDFAIRKSKRAVIKIFDAKWQQIGVAIPMPKDLQKEFGKFEHGKTRAICRQEIARKRAIVADRAKQEKETRRQNRIISLLTRISQAPINYDMVRNTGACDFGIRNWCNANNVPIDATVPLSMLGKDPQSRPYAIRVARNLLHQKQQLSA